MLSGSFDLNSINEPARNVRDEDGNPLEHHLDLDTVFLTAGYVFYPAGSEDPVIPYLAAGAGLYVGQLRGYRSSFTTEDCDEEDNCTTTTEYVDSNDSYFLTFGYFVVAGLEVPVSPRFAFLVDGRYTVARANPGATSRATATSTFPAGNTPRVWRSASDRRHKLPGGPFDRATWRAGVFPSSWPPAVPLARSETALPRKTTRK